MSKYCQARDFYHANLVANQCEKCRNAPDLVAVSERTSKLPAIVKPENWQALLSALKTASGYPLMMSLSVSLYSFRVHYRGYTLEENTRWLADLLPFLCRCGHATVATLVRQIITLALRQEDYNEGAFMELYYIFCDQIKILTAENTGNASAQHALMQLFFDISW